MAGRWLKLDPLQGEAKTGAKQPAVGHLTAFNLRVMLWKSSSSRRNLDGSE
jgi:hypothetical protein